MELSRRKLERKNSKASSIYRKLTLNTDYIFLIYLFRDIESYFAMRKLLISGIKLPKPFAPCASCKNLTQFLFVTLISASTAYVQTDKASAADFTIEDGRTVTTSQDLDSNETGIIEEGGLLQHAQDGIKVLAGAT